MIWPQRPGVAALLVVLGTGLVVGGGVSLAEIPRPPPPPVRTQEVSPAPTLIPVVPRPGEGAGGQDPGAAPPAARGRELPAQWPEIRPEALTLRPGSGGPVAPVDPVRVVDGVLDLPEDPDRVGWWRDGARAGAPFGTVVVAGHLDTTDDPEGFLVGLGELRPGDLVDLADDREHQRYRVTGNYLLPSADLSHRSDLFVQQRPHRLLLITCAGPFDPELGRYQDNRIVEAVPVAG